MTAQIIPHPASIQRYAHFGKRRFKINCWRCPQWHDTVAREETALRHLQEHFDLRHRKSFEAQRRASGQ